MIQKNWQTLIKPKQLSVEPGDDPKRVATVVAEPLERGFGLTLGNALRRVLLSSLQGAAVTSIQIEGVLHEFSSIPGVLEDVTDIVLNVKSIDLRMYGEGPKRMRLRATGPGEVRAGAIETGHDIDIMNPELVICTLDSGARITMELTVENGKGYLPGDAEPGRGRADRADPGRCAVQPGAQGLLPGREHPRRPGHRLRPAGDAGRDQRRGDARGRGGAGRAHPAGPAAALHQFRGAAPSLRRDAAERAAVQQEPAAQGRRARIVGALGQLPEERQHRLYRRPGAEDPRPRCCGRRISGANR